MSKITMISAGKEIRLSQEIYYYIARKRVIIQSL